MYAIFLASQKVSIKLWLALSIVRAIQIKFELCQKCFVKQPVFVEHFTTEFKYKI